MPDLEDRVAALEAAMAHPLMTVSAPPMSAEDEARFEREHDAALMNFGHQPLRILPSAPPLTPDQVRQLLRECVTVVKPGETLIVRVPVTWAMDQVSNYQKNFSDWARWLDLPFKVIVVIGEELGVAEPGGVPGAA